MKNLFFNLTMLFAFSFMVTSCDKGANEVDPSNNNSNSSNVVTTYCSEIDTWVATNYPNVGIDSVLLVTISIQNTDVEVYQVYLTNGVIAEFNVDPVFGYPSCTLLNQTGPCGCDFTYDPVCWNGVDYDNECLAICAGATAGQATPGTCDPCADCPTNFNPVCANGTTYNNECLALCEGVDPADIVEGACGPCGCPTNYDPVCGNGTTYTNECLALCDDVDQANIVPGACSNGVCDVETLFPTATVVSVTEGYANVNYGNAYYGIELDFGGFNITVYFDEFCNYYTFCDCDSTLDVVCAGGNNYINTCHAECDGHSAAAIAPGPC